MPPSRKHSAFRGVSETFTKVTWCERNRVWHENKHGYPPWVLIQYADWYRVLKRKDIEHPGPPDRHQALVPLHVGPRTFILLVVYVKDHGALKVITAWVANDREAALYRQHYP